jgi:transcriptional regulator
MYAPKHFAITDRAIMEQFIRENGFASVVSQGTEYPVASHVPVNLEENENGEPVLRGHLSKANPQWKLFESSPAVLVIFLSSVHEYISSSWYKDPNVPTWNYMSVQVTGNASLITGEKLWNSLARLTDKYEKNSVNPVSLNTLPPEVQKQINGIAGFEISILRMEASFKLSQNRNEEDFKNIIRQLRSSGQAGAGLMADAMENAKLIQWK